MKRELNQISNQVGLIQDWIADMDGVDDAVEFHESRIQKMEAEQGETTRISRAVIKRFDRRFTEIERRLKAIEKDIQILYRRTGENNGD